MSRAVYKGFSTFTNLEKRGKTFITTGAETIKRDLLNHIYTIPGERVMRPTFGTRIPLLAFQPLDQQTIDIIKEDLTKVFNADNRVRLIDMAILPLPDNNAITALVDIEYLGLGTSETMKMEFKVGS